MLKLPYAIMELIPIKSATDDLHSDDLDYSSAQETLAASAPADAAVEASETSPLHTPPPPPDRSYSTASLTSSAGDLCRICHCEAELGAPLISPCVCAGSLKYVHQRCLQQWIKSADTKSCELCKFDFQMTTKVKPFRKWQKLEMTTMERRKVLCSVTFHIVAITCVIWSLYVLIERTTQEIRDGVLEWPFWTKLIVVAIGFTGGLVFMYVQCKMYMQLCRRWRAYNRVIFIQNCPPADPNSGHKVQPQMHELRTKRDRYQVCHETAIAVF